MHIEKRLEKTDNLRQQNVSVLPINRHEKGRRRKKKVVQVPIVASRLQSVLKCFTDNPALRVWRLLVNHTKSKGIEMCSYHHWHGPTDDGMYARACRQLNFFFIFPRQKQNQKQWRQYNDKLHSNTHRHTDTHTPTLRERETWPRTTVSDGQLTRVLWPQVGSPPSPFLWSMRNFFGAPSS